jgi:polar amino acid transport system substrate-binding protein
MPADAKSPLNRLLHPGPDAPIARTPARRGVRFTRVVRGLRGLRQRAAVAAGVALATVGLFGAAHAAPPECSRAFTLGLHEHGVLYSPQTGVGIDKDIADEMARRTGCRIQTTLLPRARIWQLIESGGLDFSLSGISDPKREQYASFAWYVSNKYYLLVRRDTRVHSVRDFLRDTTLRLGVIRSFRYGESANRFVDALEEDQRLVYASALDPLYQILLENRVQGMIIEPFDYPVTDSDSLRSRTAIIEFPDPPILHGLIMSKASLSTGQQQAWREVILAMRADGTIRHIFEKYFPADLARQMTTF